MIKTIKAWWNKTLTTYSMTEDERFLANAVDMVDLERRQKQLMYGNSNRFNY